MATRNQAGLVISVAVLGTYSWRFSFSPCDMHQHQKETHGTCPATIRSQPNISRFVVVLWESIATSRARNFRVFYIFNQLGGYKFAGYTGRKKCRKCVAALDRQADIWGVDIVPLHKPWIFGRVVWNLCLQKGSVITGRFDCKLRACHYLKTLWGI